SPSPSPSPSPHPQPHSAAAAAAAAAASASAYLRDRIGHLLAGAVAIARDRQASDVILSTGQPPQLRIEGRLEALEIPLDDAELAACVGELTADHGSADLGLEVSGARVRVNAFT